MLQTNPSRHSEDDACITNANKLAVAHKLLGFQASPTIVALQSGELSKVVQAARCCMTWAISLLERRLVDMSTANDLKVFEQPPSDWKGLKALRILLGLETIIDDDLKRTIVPQAEHIDRT